MLYYKYIEVNNLKTIQEKTLDFINEINWFPRIAFHPLPWEAYVKHCPEIMSAFDQYNLKPLWAATYITHQQKHSIPHKDFAAGTNMNKCRINIPIIGCDGTYTEFFTGGKFELVTYETIVKKDLGYYEVVDDTDLVSVAKVEMTQPAVVRVWEPHQAVHTIPFRERINLTVYTDKDPIFLLEE